ncbi:unnamed protein product, partial [Mesorhabditis spiculigera]
MPTPAAQPHALRRPSVSAASSAFTPKDPAPLSVSTSSVNSEGFQRFPFRPKLTNVLNPVTSMRECLLRRISPERAAIYDKLFPADPRGLLNPTPVKNNNTSPKPSTSRTNITPGDNSMEWETPGTSRDQTDKSEQFDYNNNDDNSDRADESMTY